ncbi:CLUMA_CG000850, isoform A [Clunio marinus]|uniref:CLUMA_CG000850, isoform A n=1 Tax=Clunio marinus TaxID=568069 RepID=A0A1J1HGR6_9DIPT|nr:CLUMA_CG000850, isoform A [Clunio marinus]
MEQSIYYNEYIISSNNSINENTFNDQKFKRSPSYRLKKFLKFLIGKPNNNNKSLGTTKLKTTKTVCKCKNYSYEDEEEQYEDDYIYDYDAEIDNNEFNEELESRIIDEIKQCDETSAIYVYDEEDNCNLTPVYNDEIYVPVHFARTEEGTFFWTTTQRTDSDLIDSKDCESSRQLPAQQSDSFDRWVQA